MLLACKYEEVSVPVVEDLILISDRAYTREEVLEMESLMVNTLQFNMPVPTPYVFMRRFLKAAQSDRQAFWDYSGKKLLGTTKAECSVTSEWSPDGRYFMTATTAPRLQIDNGIKIFHHDGSLYFKKMFAKLYQADWKPEAPERFGDIAELTKSVNAIKIDEGKKQVQESKSPQTSRQAAASTVAKKPAAYRPPHAKNSASVQEELFGGVAPSEETSKNALRNKKRREKQKEKKAAEVAGSAADGS